MVLSLCCELRKDMDMNPTNKKFQYSLFSPTNIITVYTVLSVFVKMKEKLGLEAMLEYMARYIEILGKDNPQMKHAVAHALTLIDVQKIYREAQEKSEK